MGQRLEQIQTSSTDLEAVRAFFSELGGLLLDSATRQPDAASKLDALVTKNDMDNVWTLVNVGTYLLGFQQILNPNAPYHPREPQPLVNVSSITSS